MEGNHNIWGLSEKLKKICKEKGIKPYSLVKKNVKEGTIDSIMKGSMPAADALLAVARALDVSIEYLLADTPEALVRDARAEYGYSKEEREYIDRLIKIMRTKMDGTVQAIKQNIDAFLTTPDKAEELKKTG